MSEAKTGDGLPPLREVVARYEIAAKKTLGQNFLFDLNLTGKIARAAGPFTDEPVIEIGPGPGGLTRALLAQGARVIVIERDARCIAALEEIAHHYPNRLKIIEGDALAMDLSQVTGEARFQICANLPYNISTALLTRWIETDVWPPAWSKLTLMFQREVAERLVATPAQRAAYGRLSVLCGWRTQARILFDVPAAAFTPPPKITSTIVQLLPRDHPLACDRTALARVTKAAFGQRRKMLRQSLKALTPDAAGLLVACGIAETRRAEEIDLAGFVALANALSEREK